MSTGTGGQSRLRRRSGRPTASSNAGAMTYLGTSDLSSLDSTATGIFNRERGDARRIFLGDSRPGRLE